jgi:undecaprenyl-diphosphatase
MLGWQSPGILLDVMFHAGTLIAAIVYFRKDILEIISRKRRMVWLLALGTAPAAAAGVLFNDYFEGVFAKPVWAAWLLVATGLFLAAADLFAKEHKKQKNMTLADAAVIGSAQALAILPGISRSGATITAGMFAGLSREGATRFAFLLSIPIIAGTLLFKIFDAGGSTGQIAAGIPGLIAAAAAGYAAIHFLIKYLNKHKLSIFSLYCWAFAALYLLTR